MLITDSFNKAAFGKVAVLSGGWSAEREISLASGKAVLNSLKKSGVDACEINSETSDGMMQQLIKQKPDRVFVAMHGRGGEDGVIQGALEAMKIPYTGSGVFGSSVSMDKLATKQVWLAAGLPTPDFTKIYEGFDEEYLIEEIGLPVAIKPQFEGSSLGISKVMRREDLIRAWKKASRFGEVIAERWIDGDEYSVAFVRDKIFPAVELVSESEFYDYKAKYESGSTRFICPARLSAAEMADLQYLTWVAADALNIYGWGRIDFQRDAAGKFWLLEANTVPGMTSHSLVPLAAHRDDLSFDELTLEILSTSDKANNV